MFFGPFEEEHFQIMGVFEASQGEFKSLELVRIPFDGKSLDFTI